MVWTRLDNFSLIENRKNLLNYSWQLVGLQRSGNVNYICNLLILLFVLNLLILLFVLNFSLLAQTLSSISADGRRTRSVFTRS